MATISPVVVSSIANTCWRACKSHPIIRISASFGPSTVRVNTETVYLDRREAGLVMTSLQTKKEPERPAEGPRRSGFPCPPPQLVGKNRATRRVRHRAGTRTVRLPPPRRTCLPLLNRCAGYVPSNAHALGLPG